MMRRIELTHLSGVDGVEQLEIRTIVVMTHRRQGERFSAVFENALPGRGQPQLTLGDFGIDPVHEECCRELLRPVAVGAVRIQHLYEMGDLPWIQDAAK